VTDLSFVSEKRVHGDGSLRDQGEREGGCSSHEGAKNKSLHLASKRNEGIITNPARDRRADLASSFSLTEKLAEAG
jgi:hypothetical protein